MKNEILKYLENSFDETIELIETLCAIPAPSGKEEKRAEFIKNWLEENGAEGVYIDEALNVLYPVNCENNEITLFLAHTDTVFPDLEPMPFSKDEKNLYSPGVGDDTTSLAIMLMVAKYVAKNKLKAKKGILFAANSCEEGLGNLKGIKEIMKNYKNIKEVYSLDHQYDSMYNNCVGSERFEIIVETEGGHSYTAFGNKNAIHILSEIICELYKCEPPIDNGSKTTYNVGIISGGTSVNTIAQNASVLYEFRSDSKKCLSEMEEFFNKTIGKFKDTKVTVKTIGIRPCAGEVDKVKLQKMTEKVQEICMKHSGFSSCPAKAGSTDCNIPLSMGIPAVTLGVYMGAKCHTREEYVEIASIPVGLKIAAELILDYFEV